MLTTPTIPTAKNTQSRDLKFYMRKIRLNSGGYDADGRYWGIGAPLYRAEAFHEPTNTEEIEYFRAYDREKAREFIRRKFSGDKVRFFS